MTPETDYDVVIVGSGAGGMLTAIRCHDLGLRAMVVEKSHFYGGTSALSGGQFWIPGNHLMEQPDERSPVEAYLRAVTKGEIDEDKMAVYLDEGPALVRYLQHIGIDLFTFPFPDYFPEIPGGTGNRTLAPVNFDAAELGSEFFNLREAALCWRIFGRYAMDVPDLAVFGTRLPGWRRRFLKIALAYWLDIPWRRKTRRDRRLTLGGALIGRLRKAMLDRDIPLLLNTELVRLTGGSHAISGAVLNRDGREFAVSARRAVVLAAGGFEHSQELRDQYLPVSTMAQASLTPGTNAGAALRAGIAAGADTEHLEHAWWTPVMILPDPARPDTLVSHPAFRLPGAFLVNKAGKRFVNESSSYDRVGQAMIAEAKKDGGSPICWMIFDSRYRKRYAAGPILPSDVSPDARLPAGWLDNFLFRSDTIAGIAAKIGVDAGVLTLAAAQMNRCAAIGDDPDFLRGRESYDRATAGDERVQPSSCLAPVDTAPFYAIRIDLGDLGTKGGLRVDAQASVLNAQGGLIPGLYAIGNAAGSIFAGSYPGGGATLGPAMTFGYVAAQTIFHEGDPRRNAGADADNES